MILLGVVSEWVALHYVLKPRVYLNDHNDPRPLDDLSMKKQDFQMLEKRNIKY